MPTDPPIPEVMWARLPEEVREILLVIIQGYRTRIDQLEAKVAQLEARLNQNSSNSSIPPSANPPHAKPAPPKHKLRWCQFSLRSLLIFMVVAAIPCAWLGKKIEHKRREREAVEWILNVGRKGAGK